MARSPSSQVLTIGGFCGFESVRLGPFTLNVFTALCTLRFPPYIAAKNDELICEEK